MLEVKNIRVYDLCESILASGYAMLTDYDDKELMHSIHELEKAIVEDGIEKAVKENKHLKRALRLVLASKNSKTVKSHDNYLKGIHVAFDLKYTQYITKQFQRYHWFEYVSSSSLMHKITKMDFDKCCNEYVTQETIDNMKKYIVEYNGLWEDGKTPDEETAYKAFMKVISNCPMGTELFVRVSTNYKQLQTIYYQRRNHKLKEDWGAFCKFIESLPLAEYLILGKEVENAD